MERVFIIGPGGCGKTTCGRLFAHRIGYAFVDLDAEFMDRIGHIGRHIEQNGYLSYCRRNSELFYALLDEQVSDTVFALSSGFLVHEDTDSSLAKHSDAIRNLGRSILLLPSSSLAEAVEIVVSRQLSRALGYTEEKQRRTIRERYPRYLQHGDIQILSAESPGRIAEIMENEYLSLTERAP